MASNFAPKDAPDGHRTVFVRDEAIYAQSDPTGTPGDVYLTPEDIAKNTMYLYKLAVSVASDDLTIALKDLSGNDASSTNSIRVRIGDVEHTLTAALSLTIPAGDSTLNAGSAELAGNAIGAFVYLRYNATDGVCIGVARIPWARLYSDFSTNGDDETMDDESGAVWNDITNASAGDVCQNIGYFECENAGTAGYEWSAVANVISTTTYKTSKLAWTPVHSRLSTNYTNLPTVNSATYQIIDTRCKVFERHTQNATPGGSGIARFTLPFTNILNYPPISGFNGTALYSMVAWITTGILYYTKYDGTAEATASQEYDFNGDFFI